MVKFLDQAKGFAGNARGNVAVLFALSAIPVFAAVGAGVDFSRYVAIETQLNAALDAASLAAATAPAASSDVQRQDIAKKAFDANMAGGAATDLSTTSSFTIKNGVVTGEAHADMATMLLNIVGLTNFDVVARNEVALPSAKKAEVAFVLDYSGSMADPAGGQIKYQAMGQAATKLIHTLSTQAPGKVKYALVPFSQAVYVTLPSGYVKGASGTSWTGCTQDRQYPYNLTDTAPDVGNDASKWGQPMVAHPWKSSCSDYANQHLVVRPLTTDYAGLKAQIASMTPYQNTHIALGAEFGYQILSPNGAFTGATAYGDKTTSKFMVILTDGMQTEPAFGPGGSRTVAQGDSNLESICANAKASGITIVTLAYDLYDTSQRKRLQNCASDPIADFFVVNSGKDVAAAFEAITAAINQTVYLSK